MDTAGKWITRIGVVLGTLYVISVVGHWYAEATPAEIEATMAGLWRTLKLTGIVCAVFCVTLLVILALALRNSKPADKVTRKEIHNATED
jgi:hypothetical protein